jgi:hypothetical protein
MTQQTDLYKKQYVNSMKIEKEENVGEREGIKKGKVD